MFVEFYRDRDDGQREYDKDHTTQQTEQTA